MTIGDVVIIISILCIIFGIVFLFLSIIELCDRFSEQSSFENDENQRPFWLFWLWFLMGRNK